MSLEEKSIELKSIVAQYDTAWFLGDLSALMHFIGKGADDQLGKLSSPQRQLYFLGGLLLTSNPNLRTKLKYSMDEWAQMVNLLNEIEKEYEKLFFPPDSSFVEVKGKDIIPVCMSSFFKYFNQGPLNFEEQCLERLSQLFEPFTELIQSSTGVSLKQLIEFYNNLDELIQKNFSSFMSPQAPVKPNWKEFTEVELENGLPSFLQIEISDKQKAFYHYMADKGIKLRFRQRELVTDTLTEDTINHILNLLSTEREEKDFIYYTSSKPGNPLLEKPIIRISDEIYQVFEVKQVLHSIEEILEAICIGNDKSKDKFIKVKGRGLEEKIISVFEKFFNKECEVYQGYFVDGCEQDILILWKDYAFIIESKGYALREPLRDPKRAYTRIKDDFNNSIGYGYKQTRRVEEKFINGEILNITDKNGKVIKEIDTNKFDFDFSIIVTLESFGQIHADLSFLLEIEEDDEYPWSVKIDDLEVFLLAIKALRKPQMDFIHFLLLREDLHGKLICGDELEVCGAFLNKSISSESVEKVNFVITNPNDANIFDRLYLKGLGFKNEKNLRKKKSGKTLFF